MLAYVFLLVAATPDVPTVYAPAPITKDVALPVPGLQRPPTPKGNPGLWIGTDDYPNIAVTKGWEGYVAFRLTVDQSGRVDRCDVTTGSGYDILDAAACYLITARARFEPARDAKGEPTTGAYSNRVRWQLPDIEDPLPVPGTMTMTYTIDETGLVDDCKVEISPPNEDMPDCEAEAWIFEPPTGADGKPIRKKVEIKSVIKVTDELPVQPAPRKP